MTNAEKSKQNQDKLSKKEASKDTKCQGKGPGFQSLNSDAAVHMLRFGSSNNFDLFKRKVSVACMERYKNLGRLIIDEKYYVPDNVDRTLYDLTNDPHDVEKVRLREAYKHRDKEVDDMRVDRTSMYAYLISKLSKESYDEIQGHADWQTKKIEDTRDPLDLWLVIKNSHQILTTSKVATVIKKTAREEYSACKQGSFENILDYKRRFDSKLDALKASRNDVPTPADVAMDFLYGLDNVRYGDFKAEVVNDVQKGLAVDLDDLNKMYVLASRRVVVCTGKDAGGGATFATIDQDLNKKGPGKNSPGKDDEKTKQEKLAAWLAKMKCFNCGEKGHPAKACPHRLKKEAEKPPLVGMTLSACCSTSVGGRLHEFYEVCLDNGSQVNILDPRLLKNLHTTMKGYRSMNGEAETSRSGFLKGFFKCQACDTCPANILSMADVEDRYPVTYVQGESITMHMDDRDVQFLRRDKLYIADFSDWIVEDDDRVQEVCTGLTLMTVLERESLYTRKEVRRALEAAEFLQSLGYPTEHEAIKLVCSGNIRNIPYNVKDVRRFYVIYGAQVPGLRGRTTRRHPKARSMDDPTA